MKTIWTPVKMKLSKPAPMPSVSKSKVNFAKAMKLSPAIKGKLIKPAKQIVTKVKKNK